MINFEAIFRTVHGALETIMMTLRPLNEIICHPASRVDSQVHALDMPIIVDLQRSETEFYDPKIITERLNDAFHSGGIHKQFGQKKGVFQVNSGFENGRYA